MLPGHELNTWMTVLNPYAIYRISESSRSWDTFQRCLAEGLAMAWASFINDDEQRDSKAIDRHNVTGSFIHLLGLQPAPEKAGWLFLLFLMIYFGTICGNLLIITVVSYSKTLLCPMYFFLSHLSVLDILLASTILPNMLHSLLVKELIIPFSHCLTQFYFFSVAETTECLLLTVMSYDRYLAICRPLHYVLLMSRQLCWIMVITSWAFCNSVVLIFILKLSQLEFSDLAIVDDFFCDFYPLLETSITDTTIFQTVETVLSVIFLMTPFVIIIVSYIYIIVTIYKMSSISGRQKLFSTCSSHMTVVCIYYGTLMSIYLVPHKGKFHKITKYLSLIYTIATPLMNPVLYSLRNEELKNALKTCLNILKRKFENSKKIIFSLQNGYY
ncbi:olfactory receptor 1f45-like [Gastrophryne carolinensis]